MKFRFDTEQHHKVVAAAILVVTFIIYNATKAPTLSFWDCGEFISCSYILGIPHPPGTPLYVLIGRLFSIIPFHDDISARINMFSAVSGAFAAMMAYLVTFRLIRLWWRREEFIGWRKASAFFGAIVGAMMFAFGRTHWTNSTEAEVYTPAMLVVIIIIWLLLRWAERRRQPGADRYLVAITFLGFLSIGIHMTAFLFLPAVFLLVILLSEKLRKDFRFYITGFCLVLIAYKFDYFLYATVAWLVVAVIATLATRRYLWRFSLALLLAAIIGFSCQLYTPIRSSQQPVINQNNPSESYAAFKNFLERKQYGAEDMITRAFTRRGEWKNQFGMHERMGFWRFFSEQYGINGRAFGLVFVLGLLGIIELIRRRPKIGWPFLLMVFLGTVFLVWYMNFADGTHQHPVTGEGHIEVRDRDYFFTPGFVIFGIAIGMGVAGLMEMARDSFRGKLKALYTPAMVILSLLVFLAVAPIKANYFYCDRSENYVPYDFAYNYMASCEPDAILLIAGDNDTFPIWCLQSVYGIRPDVTSVNLALSNAGWYIKQIRDYMGIPLRWNDDQIDRLRHIMPRDGTMRRIQDQVMDEILNVNQWRRPINIAITVPADSRQYQGRSLENNLVMRGMVYSVAPGERPGAVDLEATSDLYLNKFRYRAVNDSTVYKDARTASLMGNYVTGLLMAADTLKRAGRLDEAIDHAKKAMELVPFEYASRNYLAQLYVDADREDSIAWLVPTVPREYVKDIYFVHGMAHRYRGNRERAREVLKAAVDSFPTFRDAFREYTVLLYEDKLWDQLEEAVKRWLVNNPGDEEARRVLNEFLPRAREQMP